MHAVSFQVYERVLVCEKSSWKKVVLRSDLEKKRRSSHQVHKWEGHREDVKISEMWPDLERVGRGTGQVCGNPRWNYESQLGSLQEVSWLCKFTPKENPGNAVWVIVSLIFAFSQHSWMLNVHYNSSHWSKHAKMAQGWHNLASFVYTYCTGSLRPHSIPQ